MEPVRLNLQTDALDNVERNGELLFPFGKKVHSFTRLLLKILFRFGLPLHLVLL